MASIPMPAWYGKLEEILGRSEGFVDVLLIGIVVISIWLLVFNRSRTLKLAWLVYLVSP